MLVERNLYKVRLRLPNVEQQVVYSFFELPLLDVLVLPKQFQNPNYRLVPVEKKSALSFVPGSHRWTNQYRQKDFSALNPDKQPSIDAVSFQGEWETFPDINNDLERYKVISWEMTPGDCVAFNGRTIHGGSGQLRPQCDLKIFNTKWLGDDVRVRFKPYGMDPDHSKKMQTAGMKAGDRVDNKIYPRFCLENGWLL